MMTTQTPRSFWSRWLLIFSVATLCWSQTGTGNIQGTVKDTSGAVIPKAKLTLLHTATNRSYNTETNDVGFFLFPSVELGDYQLTVEMPSLFKTVQIREKMNLRFNADFFNVLNRPGNPQPGSNGVIDMNTSANSPRLLQLTARFTW